MLMPRPTRLTRLNLPSLRIKSRAPGTRQSAKVKISLRIKLEMIEASMLMPEETKSGSPANCFNIQSRPSLTMTPLDIYHYRC